MDGWIGPSKESRQVWVAAIPAVWYGNGPEHPFPRTTVERIQRMGLGFPLSLHAARVTLPSSACLLLCGMIHSQTAQNVGMDQGRKGRGAAGRAPANPRQEIERLAWAQEHPSMQGRGDTVLQAGASGQSPRSNSVPQAPRVARHHSLACWCAETRTRQCPPTACLGEVPCQTRGMLSLFSLPLFLCVCVSLHTHPATHPPPKKNKYQEDGCALVHLKKQNPSKSGRPPPSETHSQILGQSPC